MTTDDESGIDGEHLFLAVVVFLLLKGLIDANDVEDRKRVEATWKRVKRAKEPPERGLFGALKDDLFG